MKAKPKPVLLASSPTKDGILEMVRKYYCGTICQPAEVSPDNYVVHKGRYRFLMG